MHAYVIDIMVVLIIFPVILQTVINVIMLSTGGQRANISKVQMEKMMLTKNIACIHTLPESQAMVEHNRLELINIRKKKPKKKQDIPISEKSCMNLPPEYIHQN